MRILYDNEAYAGRALTASSEATGYAVSQLENHIVARRWRATGDSAEWAMWDAGAGNTITVTDCALNGHNFSSGAVVKIQGNATDSWGSPSVDETITYNAEVMYKQFTGGAYRYWRVSIVDASNPDTYVEVGVIFFGEDLDLGDIIYREYAMQYEDTSIQAFTQTGQLYGDQGIVREIYNFQFPFIDTEKSSIDTWYDTVGKFRPWFMLTFPADLTNHPIKYVVFTENLDWNHIFNTKWNLAMSCMEVF